MSETANDDDKVGKESQNKIIIINIRSKNFKDSVLYHIVALTD